MEEQMLRLTHIECTLLLTLMSEGRKVLTHQSLLHAVWGAGYHKEVDYIRVYLHTLRLKLEDDHGGRILFPPAMYSCYVWSYGV
ncbi:winged helix-turn-helix domain-containing protein [Ktedonobacter robiniae]|uniref:OmpR/PhoB-type domain-containing protein n=1 Tax=Ktedonobacter robiniae TaxID=2778365 RepID=A0ABQ3V4F5_9CHLR|nr:winged helix-turn-helix domain-containing protein [Ktedonobacter robiniae]GHO60059.1 hypothetical protein KSB_85340 [Ktedonobacter robiniae]